MPLTLFSVRMSYMYGVCCIPFLFLKKTAREKYIFQILSQKNAQIRNLKNPDLDLIRIIHPECEFYGFMIRFRIRKPGFGFFPKTRTLMLYKVDYYSFKIFSRFWLAPIFRLILHNQLALPFLEDGSNIPSIRWYKLQYTID